MRLANESAEPSPGHPAGAGLVLVLLVAAWIGLSTVVLYPSTWAAEQFALVTGGDWARSTWVFVVAGHALAVLLPSFLAFTLTRGAPRYRPVFQTWLLAGVFMLFMLPVRLAGLADAQTAAGLQILCLAAYLAALWLWQRTRRVSAAPPGGSPAVAILAAGLVVWPWVMWGALGSWLDTLLNLIVALLFGLAVGQTLQLALLPGLQATDDRPRGNIALGGLVAALMLMVMGAALGVNGQQLILLFLLPALGWLVLGVACWAGGDALTRGWAAAGLLVALVAAGPLLFIDPDELLLVLNLGARDVGYYAILAVLLSGLAALALGLLLFILANRLPGWSGRWTVATALVWAGLFLLYGLIGQPGWHGERLFVILHDQADLSGTAEINDPAARRAFVFEATSSLAEESQSGLRQRLDSWGIDFTPYYLVNALEVDAGPFVLWWLERQPGIDRVITSPELRPLSQAQDMAGGGEPAPTEAQWNLTSIGAPAVWEEFGVTGQGIVIGQADSGVDGTHLELADQYRGAQAGDLSGDDYNWLDPWNATPSPVDLGGHGTHTLGSVLGRTVGVAPQAGWIGCVNLARNLGNPAYYLDCLQFLFAPYPQDGDPFRDGRPDLGAHILNNSWGCPVVEGCDPESLLAAVVALRAAGVFVVASAGNEGDTCGSIADPIALYDEVFTVGAVDETGDVAPFSSRGPVISDGSNRTKPDIVAPGVGVLSAFPGGTYELNSGTSMAGPHVAGVVALLWSANPDLIGDIEATEQILTETTMPFDVAQNGLPACGEPEKRPDNAVGHGLVDAYAAVARALGR
jgi:hypothetical protein